MPVSKCTRCDQLIEYDAPHEGDEVLCPACDNITLLLELPPETETGVPSENSSHKPIRLAATDLPPPQDDPVAPLAADPDEEASRGPDQELFPDNPSNPIPTASEAKGSDETPQILLVADSEADDEEEAEEDFIVDFSHSDGIRLRLPLHRPWLMAGLVAAVASLVSLLVYTAVRTPARERVMSMEELQAILAAQPRVGLPETEASPKSLPSPRIEPAPQEPVPPIPTVAEPQPSEAKASVDVIFPNLPTELRRDKERAESDAFRFYTDTAFSEAYRLFGDTVIDLRTLRFAANAGMTDFPDNWRLLGGQVRERGNDGLLLELDRRYYGEARNILVKDFPEIFLVKADDSLGLLARLKGSDRVKTKSGDDLVVETYEFGLLPSEPMVMIAQIKASEREAATRREMELIARRQADEAALEETKQKQQLDERTISFLRSRVKLGSATAQYRLGLRYLDGEGVPKNTEEAHRLLQAAAVQNHREAKAKLAELGLK